MRCAWKSLRLCTNNESIFEYGTKGLAAVSQAPLSGTCTIRYEDVEKGGRILLLSGAIEADKETLYLEISCDISSLFEARRMQQQTYRLVFFLMTVLCALLSYSISRVLTEPLVKLSKASRAIAAGQLSSRVRIYSKDEIGLVACDFNEMAETLEANISQMKDSMERQERFMGSFAHEMKTPMTSIIGYADLIRGQTLCADEQIEAANYIVSEGRRLENLSEKLLDILVLKKTELVYSKVSPASLIQGLAAHLQPIYKRQGITLKCDCEEGVCLMEAELVESVGEFCRVYYSADDVKVTRRSESGGISDYTLTLVREKDGQIETCEIPVRLRGQLLYFNL